MEIKLLFLVFWISQINIRVGAESLCATEGCQCGGVSIHCYCHHHQTLKIGLEDRVKDVSQPPAETQALVLENCHHVELYAGLLNHMENLQNLTVKQCHTVVVHPKLFEARGAKAGSETVENIQLQNIEKLKVKRYSFKDIRVRGVFFLGEVNMESVVSMAFHFKYVKEFSVFASKFERISMFGIKIDRCREFNILGMTQFSSLAAHAIKVKADKFSLAYNWFGHLHDSSFDVEFGLCDIQGNTFRSLQGKPFLSLTPYFNLDPATSQENTGLVFRENKFLSQPSLPWASLALPSFTQLSPSTSYIDIDTNQFVCDCRALDWFLAFGQLNHNSVALSNIGRLQSQTGQFSREMFRTAGSCLHCQGENCAETGESLADFATRVLTQDTSGQVSCEGRPVRNYDDSQDSKEHHQSLGRREKLVNRDLEADERLSESNTCPAYSIKPGHYFITILAIFLLY